MGVHLRTLRTTVLVLVRMARRSVGHFCDVLSLHLELVTRVSQQLDEIPMILFQPGHANAAFISAFDGNQVLLLCKRRKGEPELGWLLDDDLERLMATALRLGVRKVQVRRANREGQHVVLEGSVLARAIFETKQTELFSV
jgi:hypothetical protein